MKRVVGGLDRRNAILGLLQITEAEKLLIFLELGQCDFGGARITRLFGIFVG